MSTTTWGRRMLPTLIGAGMLASTLSGCTGGSSDAASKPSITSSLPGTAGSSDAAAVTQKYLTPATPAVLASARGKIKGLTTVPGTAELLTVQAGANCTQVRIRLSTDKQLDVISAQSLQNETANTVPDISGVTLTAEQADLVLQPGHWSAPNTPASGDCTCGWIPDSLGPAGVELSVLYPALPASVTEIKIKVPGFGAMTGPVTRT